MKQRKKNQIIINNDNQDIKINIEQFKKDFAKVFSKLLKKQSKKPTL
jgi:hypothetical protein